MALRKIDAEILWSERDAEVSEVVAGVKCRFESLENENAKPETAIAIIRTNIRSSANEKRVENRVLKAAWLQINSYFEDDHLETNLFSDLWDDVQEEEENVGSLTPEQEKELQQELRNILLDDPQYDSM